MLTADFIREVAVKLEEMAIEAARKEAAKVRAKDPKNGYGAECAYARTMEYWEENYLDTLWDEYNRLTEEYGEDAE